MDYFLVAFAAFLDWQIIHVENKFITNAFREEIMMKLPPSQFLALESHFLWMHHLIGKLFVLRSH